MRKFEKENATETQYNSYSAVSGAAKFTDNNTKKGVAVEEESVTYSNNNNKEQGEGDEFGAMFHNSNAPLTAQKYEIAEALLSLAPSDDVIEQETVVNEDFDVHFKQDENTIMLN